LLNKIIFSGVINCWISTTKYFRYQYALHKWNPSVTVHLRNSNKQRLILLKFYINIAAPIGNQAANFQLNRLKQTIVTAVFRGHPKTLQFQVFVSDVIHNDLKLKCFEVTSQEQL